MKANEAAKNKIEQSYKAEKAADQAQYQAVLDSLESNYKAAKSANEQDKKAIQA